LNRGFAISSFQSPWPTRIAAQTWDHRLFKVIGYVTVAFVLSAMIAIALNLLSAQVNNQVVTASIDSSVRSGAASFPTGWDRNPATGIDTWTDCLVMEIGTFGQKDVISALARSNYWLRPGETHHCNDLLSKIGGPSTQGPVRIIDYWRYWWGSAALLNLAIGYFGIPLPSYQTALQLITYLVVFLVASTALIRYRRGAWLFLPLAVALTFGFGLPLLGQSMAHAPGLIVGLLLVWGYMVSGLDRAEPRRQAAYMFFAGGMGFYFDLLNGDMIAVMMCFGLLRLLSSLMFRPLESLRAKPIERFASTIAVLSTFAAYLSGALSMIVLRIVLRGTLTRQGLIAAASEWHDELAKHESSHWSTSEFWGHETFIQTLRSCYYNLEVATFPYLGRHATFCLYALGAVCYFGIFAWLFAKHRHLTVAGRDRLLAAFLIASVVPFWYSLFFVHTAIHFWLMGRLLSLFFSLAVSIILIVLMESSRTGPRSN
jgi:hypothetical protein